MLLKSLYQQLCASLKAKPQCSTSMYLHIIKQNPKNQKKISKVQDSVLNSINSAKTIVVINDFSKMAKKLGFSK